MSQNRIAASEQLLSKVFSNDYVFRIPPYQRPYKWGTEQAEQLLDDLLDWMGDDDTQDVKNADPYFLGSIVLIKSLHSPDAEVVDGQQRLTTLTILFSALRETIDDQDFRESLTEYLYQRGNKALGTENVYRLTLRTQDAAFFNKYVQTAGGMEHLQPDQVLPDSQARIRDNALRLRTRLGGLSEARRGRLVQLLSQKCYLVVVCTEDSTSAFRIFSVMNDRGLDLTHADILKADVIGALPIHLKNAYTVKWEEAENALGQEAFKDLFSHMRMIYHPVKLRRTVLEEVREFINPKADSRGFVDEKLIPLAEAYESILKFSFESVRNAEEINRLFGWFDRLDNNDWVPPAIQYLAKHRNDPDKVLAFLRELDRLAYGLLILRANITERINRYAKVITWLADGKDPAAADSPLQLSAEEQAEIVHQLDGNLYDRTLVRLPVLLRLDEALSGGGARYDYKTITIEHVLPQSPAPGSQWLDWFPDEAERVQTVHRLGNLALLTRGKNAQASNFEFDRKKSEYFVRRGVSPFTLTTQVLNEPVWTPAVFAVRQAKLLGALKKLWRLS